MKNGHFVAPLRGLLKVPFETTFIYVYIYIHMRGSCLLPSQVQLTKATSPNPRLSFDIWALYADMCLRDSVWDLVCFMCGI